MAIPAGFKMQNSGYYTRITDNTGPYVFDGTNMRLVAAAANNPPAQPVMGTASISGTTITAPYSAPADNGGSAVTSYDAALLDQYDNVLAVLTGVPNPAVFTSAQGVSTNVAYKVRVRAVNSVGPGSYSAASNIVTASIPPPITALNSATLFGDSLMAYGNPVVAGSSPAQGGGTSESHVGWANDILRQTGVGIDGTSLRAVGGTTAQNHLNVQLPLALADSWDGAWYHGGVNSYNDTISAPENGGVPYTQAQNIAAVTSIVNQLSAAKKWVIVDSINPVSQSGSTGAKSRATEFPAHNAAIKALCNSLPNVIFFDEYSLVVDPASQQFNPLPNLIQGTDGIHRTTYGARAVGAALAALLASKLSLTKYKTAGSNLLPAFTGTGGTKTQGTGTITGEAALPANWNCQVASGSANVVLSNPVPGTVRMSITNPSGSVATTVYLQPTNNAALLAAIGNGSLVQAGMDFASVGTSVSLTRIAASIRINGSGGTIWNAMARDTNTETATDFKYNQAASNGRRWTHPWVVPSVPTSVELLLAVNLDPSGSAVVDISSPILNLLT